jgi:D-serine deaminase-like pyridoxal phosphate-dependent protein
MKNIKRPTLIINEEQVRRNIRKVKATADNNNCTLRPHFKTHQSADVGNWFKEEGIEKITVSSVSMAQYFADAGWQDITIAFPYNPLEIDELNTLNEKINLNIVLESLEALHHVEKYGHHPFSFFVKIDVGSHRTGLEQNQMELIKKLAIHKATANCKGFLAHAGHTYRARGKNDIKTTHENALRIIKEIKEMVGNDELMISYGDTPSSSIGLDFEGVDELRPGNFAYYDTMQAQIGSCNLSEIAVALAVPVVAKHPSRDELVVYGGAVHLSKDRIEEDGNTSFGRVVKFSDSGWQPVDDSFVTRLSQEHGIIKMPSSVQNQFQIGDILGILPVHSCLCADMMTAQQTLEGKSIEKMAKI